MTETPPRPVVAAFDFDGTISRRDTFLPFLMHAFGPGPVLKALGPLWLEGAKVLLKRSNRNRFKAELIQALFPDAAVPRLQAAGLDHARRVQARLRPAALERIAWHRACGHRLVMVSASLDLYLGEVATALGFDDLLCTRVTQQDARFLGQMAEGNCRGPEKVRRLEQLLGDLTDYEIYAYGDSDGDRELLAAADHAFYKPFRG